MILPDLNDLPPVLSEETLNCFKFLYEGELRDGLLSQGELFYRLYSVETENRAQLYQDAWQISRQESVVITATSSTCSILTHSISTHSISTYSIWVSLRGDRAEQHSVNPTLKKISGISRFKAAAPAIIETTAERTATALAHSLSSER